MAQTICVVFPALWRIVFSIGQQQFIHNTVCNIALGTASWICCHPNIAFCRGYTPWQFRDMVSWFAISKRANIVFWGRLLRGAGTLIGWRTWRNILGWMRSYKCRPWVRRDVGEGNLEWASIMEECRRELPWVCQKVAQAVGWQHGRPCSPYAPKPGEQRQKAMRTGRGGGICLHQAMRTGKQMQQMGKRACPSDPWLAPVHVSVEHDLV